MDPVEVPDGIDLKSACRVEITVNAYFTIKDDRREYNWGRTVSWIVDSEKYAIIDLKKDIAPYFTWGNDQVANFWVRSGDNVTCKLASDTQLLDLLRASRLVKLFMVVGGRKLNVREEDMPAAGEEEMVVPCLTYVVPPRKFKSKVVEIFTVDAEPSQTTADPKVMSRPGVTRRSMSSLSPISPGPTTRRMASISPEGINRRLIIS